jgi:hypothetical protein
MNLTPAAGRQIQVTDAKIDSLLGAKGGEVHDSEEGNQSRSVSTYAHANTYQSMSLWVCEREEGRPVSVSKASPLRVAVNKSERKLSVKRPGHPGPERLGAVMAFWVAGSPARAKWPYRLTT